MRDTMRDGIPASATARLFLICALALIGAFVRPGASAPDAAATIVAACAAPDRDAAWIAQSTRDGVLRGERARGVCAAAPPVRGGTRPATAAAAPGPAGSRAFMRPRHDGAAPPTPRKRAHTARGPPRAAG
ncbi:hypothetical protein [Salinarimonas sp.]|uniref:hypothetical protein n=1 Tax=Salinarimonas sp. TaxID=2766526 RepID=UPI0032D8C812